MIRNLLLRSSGFTVLAVLLMAGAAQSLSGTNTVFTDDISDGNVQKSDIAANAVTTSRIRDGNVTRADIALGAVSSGRIADGGVRLADLGANSVDSSKILDGSVASGDITDGTVASADVADNALTGDDVDESKLDMKGNCSIGMLQGTVLIQGATALRSADYTTSGRIFEYNCNGGTVTVKRVAAGHYFVKWQNSGHRGAVATIDHVDNPNLAQAATVADRGAGEIEVFTSNAAGTIVDADVEVLFW